MTNNQIICKDEKGNTFTKKIEIKFNNNKAIISLGFPCEWYYETLHNDRPINGKIYIDAMGRNHKNNPVFCDYDELILKSQTLLKKLQLNWNYNV